LDWESPPIQRNWRWPGERITIQIYDPVGNLVDIQPFLIQLLQPGNSSSIGPFTFDGNHGIIAAPGAEFLALFGTRPIGYSNGTHVFKVSTYGYVQPFLTDAVGVEGNATTDLRINLIIGVNITLNVKFKAEGIFMGVPFNMSMRIRVFNDVGDLVGAWLTGSADDVFNNVQLEAGLRQNPITPALVDGLNPVKRNDSLVWYVPGGTTDAQVTISGIPLPYSDPVFPNQTAAGIKGAQTYGGMWTAEVDTVNWYLPDAFYPLAPSLLQGESYHIIEGQNYPYGWTGELLSPNHLGPFTQLQPWLIPNARQDSDVSTVQSLELNGYVQGQLVAFTWSDETRSASWTGIKASGNTGLSLIAYSLDGFYDMYLPAGNYNVTVTEWSSRSEGHKNIDAIELHISPGQNVRSMDFIIDESAIPIPEPSVILQLTAPFFLVLVFLSLRWSREKVIMHRKLVKG
jgi:hypothetical protein